MPIDQFELLPFLLRSAVLLGAGYFLVFSLLKVFRIESPLLHRFGCLTVLALGWFGSGVSLEIPYTATKIESSSVSIQKSVMPNNKPETSVSGLHFEISRLAVHPEADAPGSLFDTAEPDFHDEPRGAAKTQAGVDLFRIWFAGIVFVLARFVFSHIVYAFRTGKVIVSPDDWIGQWVAVLTERSIRRKIPMLVSKRSGPALVRKIFGYVLVVPEEYWQRLSPEERLAVLRHEREHFLRRDALKSFFVRILSLPQWFNPGAWLAVRRFDEAAEWACDEAACQTGGDSVADFASALVLLHEMSHRPALLSGFAARKPSHRILRLVQFHQQENRKDSRMKKTLVLCLFTLLLAAGVLKIRFVEKTVAETPILVDAADFASEPKPVPIYGSLSKNDGMYVSHHRGPAQRAAMEIIEKLHEPFSYDSEKPIAFGAALKLVNEKTQIPIFIDWGALKEKNVDEKTLVKFRLPVTMPLKDALEYLLRQHDLVWVVKNEMLQITVKNKASDYVTKTYYVGDLLQLPANFKPGMHFDPAETTKIPFGPLMDYILTMVAPETWKGDGTFTDGNIGEMMEYYPNLSLVVRQTEDVHAQIIELLKNLRQHVGVQIAFEAEFHRFDAGAAPIRDKDGKPETHGLILFNGQSGNIAPGGFDGDYFVKLQPRSGQPVRKDLEAKNEPFLFHVPKGKTWTVDAVATKRNGNDIVKATLKIDGKPPETRVFYASPVIQEKEEEYLTGIRPAYQPANLRRSDVRKFVRRVYDVTDLVGGKADGMTEVIDLVENVVSPDTWDEGATITQEGTRLVILQDEEVHMEIVDLFKQLRELNDYQISYEISVLRLSPKTPEEEGVWKTTSYGCFNGQSGLVELDADSAHVVRVRPHESTLLETDPVERKKEILVPVPKGGKLAVQGVVSEDRLNIRITAGVEGREGETVSFRAKPVEVEKKPKTYFVGEVVTAKIHYNDPLPGHGAFVGRISCQITEVTEDGRLTIEGAQTLKMSNGTSEVIHVTGKVRPENIKDGTVESRHVENLTVKQVPSGEAPDASRKVWDRNTWEIKSEFPVKS